MKVAIMQPYFFPYLGYWQLMAYCDVWVVFEEAQFNKRSWMARNRILHPEPDKQFQYINIGLEKVSLGIPIAEVKVLQDDKWRNKILAQLEIYKKLHAPFYPDVRRLVETILHGSDTELSGFFQTMAQEICSYLGLDVRMQRSSKIAYDQSAVTHAGEWALEISKALKATEYINPPGGAAIFREEDFERNGIELNFLVSTLPEYKQAKRNFLPGLSIIDVLMFNSPDNMHSMLESGYNIKRRKDLLVD